MLAWRSLDIKCVKLNNIYGHKQNNFRFTMYNVYNDEINRAYNSNKSVYIINRSAPNTTETTLVAVCNVD